MDIFYSLNWGGLLIGAVLAFVLGWVWYSPAVFGKAWMSALGKTPKQLSPMLPALLLQAVYTLLLAVFIAILYSAIGDGFCVVVLLLMGLQFLGIYCLAVFQNQNRRMPCISGSYEVAMTLIIATTIHLIAF